MPTINEKWLESSGMDSIKSQWYLKLSKRQK